MTQEPLLPTTQDASLRGPNRTDKPDPAKDMADNDKPAGLDFLDFLFTVAISVGLTPELLNGPFTGLLTESSHWKVEGPWPTNYEWIEIGAFFVGFLNLTLSWFGYHASIRTRPLNYFSGYGMVRFMLDVLLVIVYGIILIKYQSPPLVFFLLLLVWLIFVLWDALKICEYWQPKQGSDTNEKYFKHKWDEAWKKSSCPEKAREILRGFRREFVTLVWFLVLLLVVTIRHYYTPSEWPFLVAAALVTILYRFNKNHATWERIFGVTK